MKRGLITWDSSEIPPAVFNGRLDGVRRALKERDLPALVIYSDMWRSNQARFFFEFHAVLQSRLAAHIPRYSADPTLRSLTACIRLDPVRHHDPRCPAGGELCGTTVRHCRRAQLDPDRSIGPGSISVRHRRGPAWRTSCFRKCGVPSRFLTGRG